MLKFCLHLFPFFFRICADWRYFANEIIFRWEFASKRATLDIKIISEQRYISRRKKQMGRDRGRWHSLCERESRRSLGQSSGSTKRRTRVTWWRWSSRFWMVPASGRRRSLLQVCGQLVLADFYWFCALSVPHATSVSSVWCPSRYMIYVCVCCVCLYIFCKIASHHCLHIPIYIYIMRVRTRLSWLFIVIVITPRSDGNNWLLVAVARVAVYLIVPCRAYRYWVTTTILYVILFPYVIPRPLCNNMDDTSHCGATKSKT